MATQKKKPTTKKVTNRASAKKQTAKVSRLGRLLRKDPKAKRVLIASGAVLAVAVLGLTGYTHMHRYDAYAAGVNTSGYSSLGSSRGFKYYMCRVGTTSVKGIMVANSATNKYTFNGSVGWMGSTSDVNNIKVWGDYSGGGADWKIGNYVTMSMGGLNAKSYVRILGLYYIPGQNAEMSVRVTSAGSAVRNLKVCK